MAPCPDLREILQEQFEFLILHLWHHNAECDECQRLEDIKEILLEPFE